jgi:hypothetical protein
LLFVYPFISHRFAPLSECVKTLKCHDSTHLDGCIHTGLRTFF